MVTEGLHSFYLKPSRDLCDLKIFIKPDQNLLQHRKIVRDVNKRNSTKETVIKSINERKVDMVKFIEVQEKHADLIFSNILPYNLYIQTLFSMIFFYRHRFLTHLQIVFVIINVL